MSNIQLEISGKPFFGFEEVHITKSLDTLCGTFHFTTTYKALNGFPIAQNDSCIIYVEGESVINGYIERFNIHYDKDSHLITVSGRDKTADIADSTLGAPIIATSPISLEGIAKKVLDFIGATDIEVRSDTAIDKFNANEIIAAKIGQNAFEFIEYYARLRQVLVTTDHDGNLLFTRASPVLINTGLVNRVNGLSNNITEARLSSDFTNRFHKYTFQSSGNPSASILVWGKASTETPKQIANKSDEFIDDDVRVSRVLVRKNEKSSDLATIKNRAKWEARIRRTRSFSYTATVVGFLAVNDNETWKQNMLVAIDDDFMLLTGNYLVNSVTFSLTNDLGSLTTLSFVDKNAYDIKLEVKPKTSGALIWK